MSAILPARVHYLCFYLARIHLLCTQEHTHDL
jgi:hypothetical protein